MNTPGSLPPQARTWRDIPQEIAPRAMSREGRKRVAFSTAKTVAVGILLAAAAWAAYEIYSTWETNPVKIKAPVKASPVKAVTFRTDGVLTRDWVMQRLALPKGADMMELDLFALRERLVAHPQIRNAIVSRRFPDTLVVIVEERNPVARVRVTFSDTAPADYCVARDGALFEGVNFRPEFLESLPYVEGVKVRKTARGLAPIDGMDTVTDLIVAARANIPTRYATWRSLVVTGLTTDGIIRVKSTEIPEIIFGTRDDFSKQIAQLDFVIDEIRLRSPQAPIKSINLAVGLSANGVQVPVAFDDPAPADDAAAGEVHKGSPARDAALNHSPLFNFQRSTSL